MSKFGDRSSKLEEDKQLGNISHTKTAIIGNDNYKDYYKKLDGFEQFCLDQYIDIST